MAFSVYYIKISWNLFLEKNKRACPFIREVGALMLEGNFIFSDRNFVRKADGSGITFTKVDILGPDCSHITFE